MFYITNTYENFNHTEVLVVDDRGCSNNYGNLSYYGRN